MKIKKLHLKGYKRFHDLTIDLGANPARIIALVGPNGCGKSSVFDSMLFVNNNFSPIGNQGNSKSYTYHSLTNNPGYNYQNIEIVFDEGTFEDVFYRKQETGEQNIVFSFRSSFRYNGTLDVRNSEAVSDLRTNNYGASSASDLDQRIEQNYRRLKIKYEKYRDENDVRPSEAKRHVIDELNVAIQNCISLTIDNLGSIDSGQGAIFFSKDDTPKAFSYNVLSSGEKEVVDILLDLYLRKDVYTDSIYIIDEPELHLNTAIQRKLLFEINKMVPKNCQIWIATHSIGFLRALQEELNAESQIIKFSEENKWASQTYELRPLVKCRSTWKELFQTALDDLTNLVAPKRIIYCEGRDRPSSMGCEQGLDANVFNTIFGEKYPETLFVSSGGNTELDQRSEFAIVILSKVFSNIEILVLKDRDMASGRIVEEGQRQCYLQNNSSNHRVLKRFELENYLYDKEVLIKYCSLNKLVFNETEYDNFVTDIVNQNVKDATGRIKNICGIRTSINPEVFKRNLAKCVDNSMKVYEELERVIFHRE
ncbi:AAA family ATPase [Succiniclasticum ruminis]|uniref:AAA domain-containing protein, putative AbiEii toxin, Type IV TA system n=1 Tax=Succiniclasticum ruminis DSM 9236 TaxID=1123323 RepID=A0A1I2CLU5_9FIRM|nr:AAA family ATPase [Succiniclasticum ruminis]SFE69379.1 AAA domain-containing protein, putative AbiEii toxin, Type IV TA system [Succiniclasticum ruminis DSM 9236]